MEYKVIRSESDILSVMKKNYACISFEAHKSNLEFLLSIGCKDITSYSVALIFILVPCKNVSNLHSIPCYCNKTTLNLI
jgi:hypothetical protein